jgi:hypothetical protein
MLINKIWSWLSTSCMLSRKSWDEEQSVLQKSYYIDKNDSCGDIGSGVILNTSVWNMNIVFFLPFFFEKWHFLSVQMAYNWHWLKGKLTSHSNDIELIVDINLHPFYY